MADKRDLVVNDLARYEKRSDRLVLEDYSSCEVPAGCGGGILRWIDPKEALPLTLLFWSTGKTTLFFDGAKATSGRADARAGRHVLAAHVVPADGAPPQIGLALLYSDETKPTDARGPYRSRSTGRSVKVLSGAGATVLGTSKEPAGDAWKALDFEPFAWVPLGVVTPVKKGDRDWHLDEIQKRGAKVVGLRSATGPLWIRCAFEIDLGAPAGAPGSADSPGPGGAR